MDRCCDYNEPMNKPQAPLVTTGFGNVLPIFRKAWTAFGKTSVAVFAFAGLAISAQAQFVWPKDSSHNTDPSVYTEDPFIVEYRQRFFAVFKGDIKTFRTAFDEIKAMVKKNPNDARALVWMGNGETIEAGLDHLKGKNDEAKALLVRARATMAKAAKLAPKDPKIYMLQAATLYIQGQYFPYEWIPKDAWQTLADDCSKLIKEFGPVKIKKLSIHFRGEVYGELGVALYRLGKINEAKAAFQKVIELDPNTDYSLKASQELAVIAAGKPLLMGNRAVDGKFN